MPGALLQLNNQNVQFAIIPMQVAYQGITLIQQQRKFIATVFLHKTISQSSAVPAYGEIRNPPDIDECGRVDMVRVVVTFQSNNHQASSHMNTTNTRS